MASIRDGPRALPPAGGKTFAPCFAPRYAADEPDGVGVSPDMPDQGEEIGGARVPCHQEEGEGDGLVDREIVSDQPNRMLKVDPLLLQAQGVPDLLPQEGSSADRPIGKGEVVGDPARVW